MGSNILEIVQSVFSVFHRFKCYSKDEKLLYNVRETAAVLGVNVHLVYELINRKLLPALRLEMCIRDRFKVVNIILHFYMKSQYDLVQIILMQ